MTDKFGNQAINIPEENEMEQWVPAPGYEDRYEVSNFGNIRFKKTGKLRTISYDHCGYPMVCLKINNKVHQVYLHRLVCQAFNGDPTPENNVCDHLDHCIVNNYYKNLRWTDHRGNNLNRNPNKKAKHNITLKDTPIVWISFSGDFH